MLLSNHIKRLGLSNTEYAKKIGVSHPVIYKALKGDYSPDTAQKIFDESGGKVVLVIKPKRKTDGK